MANVTVVVMLFLFLAAVCDRSQAYYLPRITSSSAIRPSVFSVDNYNNNNIINNSGGGRGPPRSPSSNFMSGSSSPSENDSSGAESNKNDGNSDSNNNNNNILQKWRGLKKETREDITTTLLSLAIALIVRLFLFEPRYIPSLSMFPTFDIGDQLIVDKISNKFNRPFQRRDVVVFNPPETYIDLTGNSEALIKRIVAKGGDIVEVKNRHLYVNGKVQVENYLNEEPDYSLPPVEVPQGAVLVLGDNRNHSFDSHIWGFLPEDNIVGRAVLKYWPPWRAGFVEGSN